MDLHQNSVLPSKYLLFLVLCCCSPKINADVFIDADFQWIYEDNISNAKLSSDVISDSHFDAEINMGKFIDFDDGISLTMNGALELTSFNKLSGLDHIDIVGALELRKKLGVGPWVSSIGTKLTVIFQNSESRVRDQRIVDINLFWKKRLDEDWDIRTEIGFVESTADNIPAETLITPPSQPSFLVAADVFDNNAFYLGVSSGYVVSDRYFLEFNYQFRSGDIVSTAAPNVVIRDAADALVRDPAFGNNAVSYKIDADSHSFGAVLNMEITQQASLSVEYQYRSTKANQGMDYNNNRLSLQLGYQF